MSSALLPSPSPCGDHASKTLFSNELPAQAIVDAFESHVFIGHAIRVVHLAGELDLSTRLQATRACLDGNQVDVHVDLRDLTFMDCSGYGGLVAARVELERRGGSLTMTRAVGEPARLLQLLTVVVPR